jgi:hypothetical protein
MAQWNLRGAEVAQPHSSFGGGMLTFLAIPVLISQAGVMAPGPIAALAIGGAREPARPRPPETWGTRRSRELGVFPTQGGLAGMTGSPSNSPSPTLARPG